MKYQTSFFNRKAFTLVELLVVIAVIGILTAIVLPCLGGAKEKARRAGCMSNLRQVITGALLYADDDEKGNLSAAVWEGDRNLNWLFPTYIGNPRLFVCPSTRNGIRNDKSTHPRTMESGLKDLFDLAGGKESEYGTSYLVSGFMAWRTPYYTDIPIGGTNVRVPFVKKTLNSVNSYVHYHDAFELSGVSPGPSNIQLFLDNTWFGYQDYPEAGDNHGSAGSNIAFCDGHVEWVRQSQFVFAHEFSQDDNRSGITYPP